MRNGVEGKVELRFFRPASLISLNSLNSHTLASPSCSSQVHQTPSAVDYLTFSSRPSITPSTRLIRQHLPSPCCTNIAPSHTASFLRACISAPLHTTLSRLLIPSGDLKRHLHFTWLISPAPQPVSFCCGRVSSQSRTLLPLYLSTSGS